VKPFQWNPDKNYFLIKERGVSFENIVFALQSDRLLDDISHPNIEKYPHQRILIVAIDDYAYLVLYVENEDEIFLKTIIPSRKATKHYLGGLR